MLLSSLPLVLPYGAIPALIILFFGLCAAAIVVLDKFDFMSGIEGTVLTIGLIVAGFLAIGYALIRFE